MANYPNPVKDSVRAVSKPLEAYLVDALRPFPWILSGALFAVAIVLFIAGLVWITRNMRLLFADHIETMLNDALQNRAALGVMIGALITIAVQSSSITTSLLVPLFAAGVLRVDQGFPIVVGANLGTTITALLAALVGDLPGLQIALVHLLFNVFATCLFLPIPRLRAIPVRCAHALANAATQNRVRIVAYVGIVFLGLPLAGIALFSL